MARRGKRKKKKEKRRTRFQASKLAPYYSPTLLPVSSLYRRFHRSRIFPFVPRRFSTGCEAEESSSGGSKQGLKEGGRLFINFNFPEFCLRPLPFHLHASTRASALCTSPLKSLRTSAGTNEKHNRIDYYYELLRKWSESKT